MSERAYFSLRYALPGYTFVLMVVMVTLPELYMILFQKEQVAFAVAFLTFLSLLSGGALGFLVSQVWYVVFNSFIMGRHPERTRKMMEKLVKKYNLIDDRYQRVVFTDYIYRLNENEKLRNIIERRYDLMHLFGSTLVSTITGYLSGVCVRIYLSNSTLAKLITMVPGVPFFKYGVFLAVVILVIFLILSLKHVMKLHAMPFEIAVTEVVNSGKFTLEKAKEVFPLHYFKK